MQKKLFILFLKIAILLLSPIVITMIFTGNHSKELPTNANPTYISIAESKTSANIERFEYIKGIVAGMLGNRDFYMSGSSEIVKMYGVIINTYMAANSDLSGFKYLNPELRRQMWGNDSFEQNEALLTGWLSQIDGLVIKQNGNLITPYFHQISAGATRNGPKDYLIAVDATKDIEHPDFLSVKQMSCLELCENLTRSYPDCGISISNAFDKLQIISKDSSGYVTQILVGNKTLTGEEFMTALSLSSPSFHITFDNENNTIKFITKGIGHGYGISLNYAEILAQNQQTYDLILSYFYNNIEITNE